LNQRGSVACSVSASSLSFALTENPIRNTVTNNTPGISYYSYALFFLTEFEIVSPAHECIGNRSFSSNGTPHESNPYSSVGFFGRTFCTCINSSRFLIP